MVRPYLLDAKSSRSSKFRWITSKTWDATTRQTEPNASTFLPLIHNINLIFNSHSLMCMCPGIFSYEKKKKTKHLIIITITKKPKLINYNNAPLTKTKLLKNIIKIGHDIEKKTTSGEELNTRGRGKRPEASTLKEYMEFPWSVTCFLFRILIYLFPHHLGCKCSTWGSLSASSCAPPSGRGGGEGGRSCLELLEDIFFFFKELSWMRTSRVQQ